MRKAAIGSFLLGAILQVLTFSAQDEGSFLAILRQINYISGADSHGKIMVPPVHVLGSF